MNNGDYAVLRLTGVNDPDAAAVDDGVRQQLESGLENMRRSVAVSTMTENLRARADIVIPEKDE